MAIQMASLIEAASVIELKIIAQLEDVQNIIKRINGSTKSLFKDGSKVVYNEVVIKHELASLEIFLEGIRKEMDNLRKII